MAAVIRQRASSVDEKLCLVERLNNGKTHTNISCQKQNNTTSDMRHTSLANPTVTEKQTLFHRRSRTEPWRSNFGCDSELKFVFLTTKLALILTLTDSHDALERIFGAVELGCRSEER